jgi:hypothetical protein
MTTPNEQHAILIEFSALNEPQKQDFLFLTKSLFQLQKTNEFTLLNPQFENLYNNTTDINMLLSIDYSQISKTYQRLKNFKELKKILKRTQVAKLSKTLEASLENGKGGTNQVEDETKATLTRFFNRVTIINLLKKNILQKIRHNTLIPHLQSYYFFKQLNEIHPQLTQLFHVDTFKDVGNLTKEQFAEFSNTNFLYHNFQDFLFKHDFSDEQIHQIFEIVFLFQPI